MVRDRHCKTYTPSQPRVSRPLGHKFKGSYKVLDLFLVCLVFWDNDSIILGYEKQKIRVVRIAQALSWS